MIEDPDGLHRRFCERSLPKDHWTHEAHLAVCWVDLRHRSPAESLAFLRTAIRAYNEVVGTPNTDDSGYHETLTAYYVGAVAAADAASFDEVLARPELTRDAPFRHWTRAALFTPAARRAWCEPDLAPLPWPGPEACAPGSDPSAPTTGSRRPGPGRAPRSHRRRPARS